MSDEQNADPDLGIESTTDIAENLFDGVPSPIKKNAVKAFGQLFSAVVDVPIAYLEGKASELRAESSAREKIITTGGEKIAHQMDLDPEYARVAVEKYGQRIVREQVNVDKIVTVAKQELTQLPSAPDNAAEIPMISEDWINMFESEARKKSSEEMQLLFGKILAGEIQQPSSFSIKSVKLISELDRKTALIFQAFCTCSIALIDVKKSISYDVRVPALGGSAGKNSLADYGLDFDSLNRLNEHGLIGPIFDSRMNYQGCRVEPKDNSVDYPFLYRGNRYVLFSVDNDVSSQKPVMISGPSLTTTGQELFPIVDISIDEKYTKPLHAYFASQKLIMKPL